MRKYMALELHGKASTVFAALAELTRREARR